MHVYVIEGFIIVVHFKSTHVHIFNFIRDTHGYGSRPHSRQHQYSHYDSNAYASAGYDNMGYGYSYHGYHYPGYGEYDAKPG